MDNDREIISSSEPEQFKIELNNAPIHWDLKKGSLTFFGLDSVLFWTNPSLIKTFVPLVNELGADLFRLIVADSSSYGTKEDYQMMVSTLGNTFEEGFLAWGLAVSSAGWGIFELPECDYQRKKATVIVRNAWEMSMQSELPEGERWGCPFLQGKIIGLFNHAFGVCCWVDEHCDYASKYVQFSVYEANKTIANELLHLRHERMEKRERDLAEKVRRQTIDLEFAHKSLEAYSISLEKKVEERTKNLELLLELLGEEKEKLKSMADTDPLTGLFNRRALYEKYKSLVQKRESHKKIDSLILFDIDHFKSINDRYGHAAGDYVLVAFSKLLKQAFYNHDIFVRFGGEEFVVICSGFDLIANPAPLYRFMKIIESHTLHFDNQVINFTVSAGATLIDCEDIDLYESIKVADQLLYQAKEKGRNQAIMADLNKITTDAV